MARRLLVLFCGAILVGGMAFFALTKYSSVADESDPEIGKVVDSLNGVKVYYNGSVSHVSGRNMMNGYNLGLKYQCVEFVKRYYYLHLHHKMPDSYGHAKDFYDATVASGNLNKKRNLIQYKNGEGAKPKPDDLLIMDKTSFNPYGHVAIISKVSDEEIEIVQQNPGRMAPSRVNFGLTETNGKWTIENSRVLGWLRKQTH